MTLAMTAQEAANTTPVKNPEKNAVTMMFMWSVFLVVDLL